MKKIEEKLGYTFKNKNLLLQAFTRRSFTNENDEWENNEVLEFIGDTMLGMVIVKKLIMRYGTTYPIEETVEEKKKIWSAFEFTAENSDLWFSSNIDEKELTEAKISLVKSETLAAAIEKTGFQNNLVMSKGDVMSGVKNEKSVMEDLFEAIIGAVTVDCNWDVDTVSGVIDRLLDPDGILEKDPDDNKDYVKAVSDWYKDMYCGEELEFRCFYVPENYLPYYCLIDIGDGLSQIFFQGFAMTEENAKRMAAKRAWKFIMERNDLGKRIYEAIGNPDMEKAVYQLNVLWQKGIINKPEFILTQLDQMSETGNRIWNCDCIIEGFIEKRGYNDTSKMKAKNFAAFETILNLCGKFIPWNTYGEKEVIEVIEEEEF